MRNLLIPIAAVAMVLAGCGKSEPSRSAFESVESLVGNPERLKELRAQCKADHARVGDAQCNAVAEATRQRFFGSGGPKYTPPASSPGGFWQEDSSRASAPAPSAPTAPPTPKE